MSTNTFRIAALVAVLAALPALARGQNQTIGNSLVPRTLTDVGSGGFFVLDQPFAGGGILGNWAFYDFEPPTDMQITPLLVQRLGTGDYQVTGVGTTRQVTNFGLQEHSFGLVQGSGAVSPTTFFAWKDGGQGSNNTGVPEWYDGSPGRIDILGGDATNVGAGDQFPTLFSVNRTYSIHADMVDPTGQPVEVVCNPIIEAPSIDDDVGRIYVIANVEFPTAGEVGNWQFFHGETTRRITPMLVEKVGSEFLIRGIGATRESTGAGAQRFDFELVSGSDVIGPNHFFAWKDGGNGVGNAGVAEYDPNGGGVFALGGKSTFYLGDNLGPALTTFNRTYSISATSVPEPSTLALAGAGGILALLAFIRRRKNPA
jgi:hypothetical protein